MSGSSCTRAREGVGNQLANIHIDGATGLMKEMFIELPDPDLAYLVEGTPAFDAYICDMLWAQDYAMGNRQRMLSLVFDQVARFVTKIGRPDDEPVEIVDEINCHHNFTEREMHNVGGSAQSVWLTRKGAIRARVGDRGVIPGSMAHSRSSCRARARRRRITRVRTVRDVG